MRSIIITVAAIILSVRKSVRVHDLTMTVDTDHLIVECTQENELVGWFWLHTKKGYHIRDAVRFFVTQLL